MGKFYTLLIILLASSGASAQTILNFTIDQMPALTANAGTNKTILKGEQITIGGAPTATGGTGVYTYSWSPGTGLNKTDVANPIATPSSTTTYTLTVNDNKNCIQSSVVTITVNPVTTPPDTTTNPNFPNPPDTTNNPNPPNPPTYPGTPNQSDSLRLLYYPNPSTGTFLITTEKILGTGVLQLEIFSISGKLIYSELFMAGGQKLNKQVKLPLGIKGMFMLKLAGSELHIIRKIIVQ